MVCPVSLQAAVADSLELTWVEALEGVEGRRGGQLEGQRGQGVLLPKDARLALADGQDLGVLVQCQVGVDRQRGNCLWLLATTALRLLLLLEALGLRLACISTSDIASPPSHMRVHDDMRISLL